MRKFGLIGYPLSHSFSPSFFAQKFSKEGISDCLYSAYPITSLGELPKLLIDHPDLEGLNVTIPYKKAVIPFLQQSTEAVAEMLACNCITVRQGKMTGYNTDVTGFEKSLLPHLTNLHSHALILGTGGASAAVAYVLKKLNIAYLFVSRRTHASSRYKTYHDLTPELIRSHKLIINTTPLGMYPDVQSFPDIPYQYVTSQHYLFDLVYNPGQTLFLAKGAENGAITKNGHDMLAIQAEESWRIWNAG